MPNHTIFPKYSKKEKNGSLELSELSLCFREKG